MRREISTFIASDFFHESEGKNMKVKVRVKTSTFMKVRVEEGRNRNIRREVKVRVSVKAFTSLASEFFMKVRAEMVAAAKLSKNTIFS